MDTAKESCVAFITNEIEVPRALLHSGGARGQIANALAVGARRLNVKSVVVSLLYREGYYDQEVRIVEEKAKMSIVFTSRTYKHLLHDTGEIVTVYINNAPVYASVKILETNTTPPIILLDADIEQNDHLARLITKRLYPSIQDTGSSKQMNDERRVAQAILLGFGAVDALEKLGYNISIYHLNDGPAAFAPLALYHKHIQSTANNAKAFALTKKSTILTTSISGLDDCLLYPTDVVEKQLGNHDVFGSLIQAASMNGLLNMTTLAMHCSSKIAGVAQGHTAKLERIWCSCANPHPPTIITDIPVGTDRLFWQLEDFKSVNTPDRLRRAKEVHKRNFTEHMYRETDKQLNPAILTIAWVHPFSEQKRPKLLFYDHVETRNLLMTNQMQLVICGKPYPDNMNTIHVFNDLLRLSEEIPNLVVCFEKNYGVGLYRQIISGADVLLNTSSAGSDGSYSRWQAAAFNGTLNCSTPVGTIAHFDNKLYFPYGNAYTCPSLDLIDFNDLMRVMKTQIIPCFYDHEEAWYEKAFAAKEEAECYWDVTYMMREYIDRIYTDIPTERIEHS